ncbi:MAG: MBOAT family protein [Myxococcaceae bacterium]|nr:MBOAT family protein [Myxococcaceae bacterium]
MLFHSVQFLAFLAATFGLYWSVARWRWARLSVLLVASIVFYAAWSPFPLLLFGAYAAVNTLAGRVLTRLARVPRAPLPPGVPQREVTVQPPLPPGRVRARKLVLAAAITLHLAGLCTFKYLDLFLRTGKQLLGWAGAAVVPHESLGLLLPVGLSFVAFQAISYVVDVYRGQVDGTHSYPKQLLHVLFFPHLVAGPIVRANDLLERFDRTPQLSRDEGGRGLFRIALGVGKKLLVADVLSVGLVDRVFTDPSAFTSAECALAVVAYTLQLYFDFSAYSDIAIGAAALFGFPFPENFHKPYHARNLFEFWNRWHVSLSTWLRDYLYIPLGGNRTTKLKVLRNLMVVMMLGGLWHGADWRFALWGTIHGVLLCATRVWWWWRGKPKESGLVGTVLGIAATFTLVCLSRIVFRAPDVEHAGALVKQLALGTWGLANVQGLVWGALAVAVAGYTLPRAVFDGAQTVFARMPVPVRAVAVVAFGLLLRQVASFEVQPYIYFQF